MCNSNLLYKRK